MTLRETPRNTDNPGRATSLLASTTLLLAAIAAAPGCSDSPQSGAPSTLVSGAPGPWPSAAPTAPAALTSSGTPATTTSAPSGCPQEMKKIDGGAFKMGSTYQPDEQPIHEAQVATFCLDRTEVTAFEYSKCVAGGKCTSAKSKHARCNEGKADREGHPMNCLDWNQATAYCEWAAKRLPTEPEWEFAARGPEARTYAWGNDFKGGLLCWNGPGNDRSEHKWEGTCPVGSYPAGDTPKTGVADMMGNVWEWTSTPYCPYDPKLPCDKKSRVLRGGSWFHNTQALLRASARGSYQPTDESYDLGFRCARDFH